MGTRKETLQFILEKLGHSGRFGARAMFGEYGIYADGQLAALVCDDLLYVKILPASKELDKYCEKASPYPGAKEHYIVEEVQMSTMTNLPSILFAVAKTAKRTKHKTTPKKRTS